MKLRGAHSAATTRGALALSALLVALLRRGARRSAGGPSAGASIIGGNVASIADFPSLAFIAAQTGKDEGFACTGTRDRAAGDPDRRPLRRGSRARAASRRRPTTRSRPAAPTPARTRPANVLRVSATHVFPGFDPGNTARRRRPARPRQPDHRRRRCRSASSADSALYAGGATGAPGRLGADPRRRPLRAATPPLDRRRGAATPSCKQRTRRFYPPYSTALQMCTTDPPDQGNGGCFGDSGGPAIAHRADGIAGRDRHHQHRRAELQHQAAQHLHPRRHDLHLGLRNGSRRPKLGAPPPGLDSPRCRR